MSIRDDVHQLVDELGDESLTDAAKALRELARRHPVVPEQRPRRRFRFAAGMSAEPDLADRSGQIIRDELGRGT